MTTMTAKDATGTTVTLQKPNGAFAVSGSVTTRPADTNVYAAGDLVANSTTAGSVVAGTFTGVTTAGDVAEIDEIRLYKSGTNVALAQFRIFMFNAVPVPTVGDNAAFGSSGALGLDAATKLIGQTDVTITNSGTAGSWGRSAIVLPPLRCSPASGTTLYYLIVALAAYVPASAETFTPVFCGLRQ